MVGRTDEGCWRCSRSAPARAATTPVRSGWPPVARRAARAAAAEARAGDPGERLRGLGGRGVVLRRPGAAPRAGGAAGAELGLAGGRRAARLPEKPRMMGLDLLLRERAGRQRLTETGRAGLIDLPRVADELYRSARAFRVFTTERRELRGGARCWSCSPCPRRRSRATRLAESALSSKISDPVPVRPPARRLPGGRGRRRRRGVLRTVLGRAGYRVTVAQDGAEASACSRSTARPTCCCSTGCCPA
jgi:hypothetical protein